MARLSIKKSETSARDIELGTRCILGRAPSVDLVLDSSCVSRRHAVIESRDGGFFISDLGSRNGTVVNGKPLSASAKLKNKDRILLGDQTVEFLDDVDALKLEVTQPLDRSVASVDKDRPTEPMRRRRPVKLPKTLGKFELTRVLGRGGMGTVFLARDLEFDKEVAVKFISSKVGRNELFLDFLHNREAVLARQIDHPNVIRIFEHGVHDRDHYISMEYVRGFSLYRPLRSKEDISLATVLEVLRQIACGLRAAHHRGVVHSDIKPANILVDLAARQRLSQSYEGTADDWEKEDDILEFSSDIHQPEPENYDDDMLKEIRRRAGIPSEEILLAPPYFERASEMRFIEYYFERALDDRGCVLVVAGEKGGGKTRLIDEFLSRQQSPSNERSTGRAVRFLTFDCAAEDALEQLHAKLHDAAQPGETKSPQAMARALVTKVAEEAVPTVVAVQKLDHLNSIESRLLQAWTEGIAERPLLLIVEVDTDATEANKAARDFFDSIGTTKKELFLRPLTEYQIQRYLAQIFKQSLPSANLPRDLYRLTRGNFQKLLDVFRRFIDRGLLTADSKTAKLVYRPNSRKFELEEGKQLYEVYRSYGRLDQKVLELSAFLGRRFYFDLLLRFQELDETTLFFIIQNLANDGFLVEEGRTWYRFSNLAFQHFLAERVPPHERPHLHRKVVNVLSSAPVPPSAALFHLRAHHHLGCNETGDAVKFLLEAAYRAKLDYQSELVQDAYHRLLTVYRSLSAKAVTRKSIQSILAEWFQREGNWYEILGRVASEDIVPWIKIADFGISFRMQDGKGLHIDATPIMGTPRYMAPERRGTHRGGPPSDVFSFGVIAYEMFFREPPFPGLKGWKVTDAYRNTPIRLPRDRRDDIPPALEELLLGMLAIDPSKRWDVETVLRRTTELLYELGPRPEADSAGFS